MEDILYEDCDGDELNREVHGVLVVGEVVDMHIRNLEEAVERTDRI
jgi:hypothetical protein